MSNAKWTGMIAAGYVLDITTNSGITQAWLSTAYPGLDATALTQTDADNTAAALETAVNSLSGVTGSTLTPYNNPDEGSDAILLFDAQDYAYFRFDVNTGSSKVLLLTASPADGVFSSGDLSSVTAALITAIEGLSGVTSCTVVQRTVTPSSL